MFTASTSFKALDAAKSEVAMCAVIPAHLGKGPADEPRR